MFSSVSHQKVELFLFVPIGTLLAYARMWSAQKSQPPKLKRARNILQHCTENSVSIGLVWHHRIRAIFCRKQDSLWQATDQSFCIQYDVIRNPGVWHAKTHGIQMALSTRTLCLLSQSCQILCNCKSVQQRHPPSPKMVSAFSSSTQSHFDSNRTNHQQASTNTTFEATVAIWSLPNLLPIHPTTACTMSFTSGTKIPTKTLVLSYKQERCHLHWERILVSASFLFVERNHWIKQNILDKSKTFGI